MAKKDLKANVEAEIAKMLASTEEPSEGRIKLLALGIKMCALNAKLEESEYGEFFQDGDGEAEGKREAMGGEKSRKDKREGAPSSSSKPGAQ